NHAEITPTATDLRFLCQLRHRVDRAHAPATTDQDLGHHHRHADQCDTTEIKQDKGAAAVFTGDIGKFPDIAQPHRRAGRCQNENPAATPDTVYRVVGVLVHSLSPSKPAAIVRRTGSLLKHRADK